MWCSVFILGFQELKKTFEQNWKSMFSWSFIGLARRRRKNLAFFALLLQFPYVLRAFWGDFRQKYFRMLISEPKIFFAAKPHCGQEVGILFFEKVTSVVLIYTYIQTLSELFRAWLRVLRPPKPIFLRSVWVWVLLILWFAGSLVDVLLLQPLQKVGWTGGCTPKWGELRPDFKLQIALSLHSEGVVGADFGRDWIRNQSFAFEDSTAQLVITDSILKWVGNNG